MVTTTWVTDDDDNDDDSDGGRGRGRGLTDFNSIRDGVGGGIGDWRKRDSVVSTYGSS